MIWIKEVDNMKDDLISRQAAVDALGEEPPVWYDGEDELAERDQWRRDVSVIKALPSAQQWIPCSERLPDDGGVFLVTTVGKSFGGNDVYTVEIMSLYHIDEHLEWRDDFSFERDWYNKKAVAWMPLLKPYKAESEEK